MFIALSLCLIWGYGGSLSFGQTAFFGIAGYGYGVLTLNFGSAYGFTLVALVAAVAIAALFAVLLGYFMFFGRIAGVFLGIVTLAVTLMLERFMAQTAGPEWRIGSARLNGFNGMSAMPPLTIPGRASRSCCSPMSGSITSCWACCFFVYLACAS